jgi:DNA polymerase-1
MEINTSDDAALRGLRSKAEQLYVYNGLDCCLTFEVFNVISKQLDACTSKTYDFSRALQAPCFEMKLRGVAIDLTERDRAIKALTQDIKKLEKILERFLREGVGTEINWRSPAQLKDLFYTQMRYKTIKKRNSKGEFTATVNREALEKLAFHFYLQPIISTLLLMRDIDKMIGRLRTDIDKDRRMRSSYNVAGTNTGRLSSSFGDFNTGTNLQNIDERIRRIFVSGPGMKLAYSDLAQAESRLVGAIIYNTFDDATYLDACESKDLHTTVCMFAWPELAWTDDIRANRHIADQDYIPGYAYRQLAKILGHGSNYGGKPSTLSKQTGIPQTQVAEFQRRYFTAFPAIARWHGHVANELFTKGYLISLTGRRRYFFGRRDDDTTLRAAIAFDPQGSVGDILNTGMLRVWRANICQLLMQIHDAIMVQYPEHLEDQIVPQILQQLQVPIPLKNNRMLLLPADVKTGWNWQEQDSYHKDGTAKKAEEMKNGDGLKKYSGNDNRTRTSTAPVSFLDRRF